MRVKKINLGTTLSPVPLPTGCVKYCFANTQFPPLPFDGSENKLPMFAAAERGLGKIMAWVSTTREGGVPPRTRDPT
jgi:hypothetical protein